MIPMGFGTQSEPSAGNSGLKGPPAAMALGLVVQGEAERECVVKTRDVLGQTDLRHAPCPIQRTGQL